MSKETYEVTDFLKLLAVMEQRVFEVNPIEFVRVDNEPYIASARVMRMFAAAHKAVKTKAALDDE